MSITGILQSLNVKQLLRLHRVWVPHDVRGKMLIDHVDLQCFLRGAGDTYGYACFAVDPSSSIRSLTNV